MLLLLLFEFFGGVLFSVKLNWNFDFLLAGCLGLNAKVLLLSSFVTLLGDFGASGDLSKSRLNMSFSVRVGVSSELLMLFVLQEWLPPGTLLLAW